MEFFHNLKDKWNILWEKCSPVLRTIGTVFAAIGRAIGTLCKYIFRLRALFMAIPVAVIAVIEAMINTSRLPDTLEYATIGLDFDATQTLFGPFVMHIEQLSRETAVMGRQYFHPGGAGAVVPDDPIPCINTKTTPFLVWSFGGIEENDHSTLSGVTFSPFLCIMQAIINKGGASHAANRNR